MLLERDLGQGTLNEASLGELRSRILGDILTPRDPGFDERRRVWNAAFDHHPAVVVRCRDAADVIQAVLFARERSVPLAVRSGGHSIPGHGAADGALVVDLSLMKGLSLDAELRIAWAEPGLTCGEYAARAQPYGLATSSGDTAAVGVGGLTLGGGIGWLVRKHGLTIDHLLAAEVVTADGRLLTACAEEHADLFWALRGGGGNFGVVTGFQLKLHPVRTVFGGAVFYPASAEVLRGYFDYAAQAPDELTTSASLLPAPPLPFIPAEHHGRLVVMLMPCYAGDLAEGERVVAPLRQLAQPIADLVGPLPYPALFDFTAESATAGRVQDARSLYLRSFDDALIETVLDHSRRLTSPFGLVQLRVLGGAMARVAADATAFAHRDQPYFCTIVNAWEPSASAEDVARHRDWTEQFWQALRPHASGAYVNFLGDEGEERLRSAYSPATLARLAAVKRQYDPTNLFRLNHNIPPARMPGSE